MEAKVADIQSSATVDWSPLGDIYVKYVKPGLSWLYLSYEKYVQSTRVIQKGEDTSLGRPGYVLVSIEPLSHL